MQGDKSNFGHTESKHLERPTSPWQALEEVENIHLVLKHTLNIGLGIPGFSAAFVMLCLCITETGSNCVAQDGLKPVILLPQPLTCWD